MPTEFLVWTAECDVT